jgi:hypothetical protein
MSYRFGKEDCEKGDEDEIFFILKTELFFRVPFKQIPAAAGMTGMGRDGI